MAAVGGGQVHVDHLNRRKLLENGPRRETGCQRTGPGFERNQEAVSDEGDEDVGFDAVVELMVDRPQTQIAFQFLEGLLNLDELDVILPQQGRIGGREIGAQQVATFPAPGLPELRFA